MYWLHSNDLNPEVYLKIILKRTVYNEHLSTLIHYLFIKIDCNSL